MKCILFDVDGTLFDSAEAIRKAVRETKKEFDLDIDVDLVISETLNMLGGRKSRFNFLIIAFHYGFLSWKSPLRILRIKDYFEKRFTQYTEENILLPGVREALEALRDFRLAVVTARGRKWTEESLKKEDISEYFEVVVTTDEVAREKPDPASINMAVDLMGVDPGECLYVGDLPSDIRAGKGAGVRTAGVLSGLSSRTRLEEENPDYIFEDLKDLASHIHSE
ncbi:MAG: HAD family hydrolase [Theionarchaea archaeon]|nr:HAD family hydrolase [Theionarchaea archaeon]MBU6999868.1 HAD family hydrolase [Theionarchaea archaeon]MBU7020058.1 HAD family hydrolase [Theionarchaea archaeon]MBU7034275.1 HAD family hydrolase [Theionarchaea archaeon]MBU7039526.1 HAD family hydrolase [Theionarchaea archaeon]